MENGELRKLNKNLAVQVEKQKQIENNLQLRISQLEEKQSEDDILLCGINRYWKILDENCRIFTKQFDSESSTELFDRLDNDTDSFLIQLSTWDVGELKEKLEKRVQLSKQNVEKMILALYKTLIKTNTLQKLLKTKTKLKSQELKMLQQNVKLRKKMISLHRNHYSSNIRTRKKLDILSIKETRNDELKNRADNLRYQNTKMKAVNDHMEHSLAELLDEIKRAEIMPTIDEELDISAETIDSANSDDKGKQLEKEIEAQRILAEQHLQELQMLNLKHQETVKQMETLKIDLHQLPENVIIQTKKYKYLQSRFSILYNEAAQLRLTWEEVQKQMQVVKSSFNSAQETSERECLLQQKNIRLEMIKLDDINGQLRNECQKLKMQLEQSIAENNLFSSLNSEMKKLMSSMLDYCKQHESDIKRYKRKYEEIEEDIRFSKAMPPVKIKCDKLIQLVRYREFHKRRMKEREAIKEKYKTVPLAKELRCLKDSANDFSNGIDFLNGRESDASKDLIDAKELQHIKNMLNSNETYKVVPLHREVQMKLARSRDPLELSRGRIADKEFLHPRETLKEAPYTKIPYSKEVLRSKEMLKERYLRDCTKMKLKELPKEFSTSIKMTESESVVALNKEVLVDSKKLLTKPSKNSVKDSGKILNIVNLDSDDSSHDEPRTRKLEETIVSSGKEECHEEGIDSSTPAENHSYDKQSDPTKVDSKEQAEVKKVTPPTKKDIVVRKLKYQLKKIVDEKKDLNLLLGMYKNMNKTDEEKVQLMVSEQKLKIELEEVKRQMRRIEESRYDDCKDVVDVVMTRKIRYLLAKRRRLQKKIEEAKDSLLCGEMEITGQVWDELQAQNTRLHQLLREKDEENLKLMTERVKSNQLFNLSKDENESMMQHIILNNEKIETNNEIIQKMEERELAYRNRLSFLEQELALRKRACEVNRRKAIENAQSTADLKRQIEKYQRLSKEILQLKVEKDSVLEVIVQKNNIMLEDVSQFRRKLERMKKYESIDTIEAVLAEELKEYKTMLTCPSCKVNTKDAVLIKCFHVYCLNCIKTRYETRQRKCPECCAPFGANDYHRLFLFN